jgi:hypothetical protein
VKTNLMKWHTLRSLIVGSGLSVVCAWAIQVGVGCYQETKAMGRGIDTLATECAARGGCSLPTPRFDY